MAKFLILSLCVALGAAAPSHHILAPGAAHIAGAPIAGYAGYAGPVAAGVAVGPTAVHEQTHVGPAQVRTHVQHGVVGHKTVLAGHKTVQVGHQYKLAGQSVEQPAPYSFVAGAPVNTQSTRPLPLAPLPHAAPYAAIPPAPRNLGPAPADTVTQEKIAAPVRTHTRITPVQTNIVPQLQVNKVPYDVPVPVPTPVERPYTVLKQVQKPYHVEVPVPVDVPVPHVVRPVQKIVKTPVIEKNVYTVQQPIVKTAVHTAHVGYTHGAAVAAAPAVAVAAAPAAVATTGYALAGQHAIAGHGLVGGYGLGLPAAGLAVGGYGLGLPAATIEGAPLAAAAIPAAAIEA